MSEEESSNPAGPFAGLRVVELGRFIAAPYCGQLLADGGADVVKVEPVSGDETRRNGEVIPGEGRQFLNKNRGKRSVAVDLDDADVAAVVRRLAAEADVVVANFRPGQAERHGLDYDSLSAENPQLIYAENTAYGREGAMAGLPGMDLAMVAYTGLAPSSPDGPVDLENPVIDYTAGLLLAWGVSTALYHRERTGRGQRIDVSLLQASLVLQNNLLNHIDVLDQWRGPFLREARERLAAGASYEEIMALRQSMQPHAINRAYYGFYHAADGFLAIAALGQKLQARLLEVVGVDDPWVTSPGWLPEDSHAHAKEIRAKVEARIRTKPVARWLEALREAGVSVAPARLRDELLEDEQVNANGGFVRLEHDLIGGLTVVAPPVRFSVSPLEARRASPPLGRDTRSVLREAGLDNEALDALIARSAVFVRDG